MNHQKCLLVQIMLMFSQLAQLVQGCKEPLVKVDLVVLHHQ